MNAPQLGRRLFTVSVLLCRLFHTRIKDANFPYRLAVGTEAHEVSEALEREANELIVAYYKI